jgi:glutamine cyclotransferase
VNTYPHDRGAFTEGLLFLNGKLLESTGMKGESSLREVELTNGQVIRQFDLPAASFGEGLAVLDGKAYQLTWQEQKCFVYDEPTFNLTNEFTYTGEGWGLTTDGKSLIMSDGTPQIRFIDPATFKVQRTIDVSVDGNPVKWVNELEYIKGEIFANVWQTPYVIRIDPASGAVTGVIDFTGLLSPADADATTDVFNGIAYDAAGDRIFVTGKRWPKLFEVRLKAVP